MNELFRKHGKWILAVLGVVLMISWSTMGNQRSADERRGTMEIGRLNGSKVTQNALGRAYQDVSILRSFGEVRPEMRFVTLPQEEFYSFVNNTLDRRQPDLHLFLLLDEAKKYNLTATPDEVNSIIARMGLTQANFETLFKRFGIDGDRFKIAIADYLVVNKLTDLAYGALRPSLPELRHMAADARSQVSVRYLVLDASTPTLVAPHVLPTPAELQAQFDAYKDVAPIIDPKVQYPLINGHRFPFAYKFPDRVQIEYLAFDRKTVRDQVSATLTKAQLAEDTAKAFQDYKADPSKFTAEPPSTTAPATQPNIKPFEEVVGALRDKELNTRTEKLLRQMADEAAKMAGEPWNKMQDDGFRVPQPKTNWVSYDKVAETLAAQARFKKYRPYVGRPESWLSLVDLANLPGIGRAALKTQTVGYPFAVLAQHVREIKHDQKDPTLRLLQVGFEGPILTDEEGNLYVYRIVDASPSHVPAKLEEVQDAVARDLRRRQTFDFYVQAGQDIARAANTRSLAAVAAERELKIQLQPYFTRLNERPTRLGGAFAEPRTLPGIGVLPEFTQAAYDLAEASANPTSAPTLETSSTSTAPTSPPPPPPPPPALPPAPAPPRPLPPPP
ncbi:MAG: hypothetical protein WCI73_17685, partial [Phycisphaerae bacterium]